MRQFYLGINLLLLMFIVSHTLPAQNKIYLHGKDGTKASFSLDAIRKLTFPSRTITLYQNNGSTQAFPFVELRQARFTEFVSGNNSLDLPESNDLVLFPNPVNDELSLWLAVSMVATIEIRILDVQGKTISIKKEHLIPGNNQINLQVADLPRGLYLCRVTNGKSTETRKFLKY